MKIQWKYHKPSLWSYGDYMVFGVPKADSKGKEWYWRSYLTTNKGPFSTPQKAREGAEKFIKLVQQSVRQTIRWIRESEIDSKELKKRLLKKEKK